LEVDGKPISQSIAIARFVARKHGLAGQNDWESAQADVLVDYVSGEIHNQQNVEFAARLKLFFYFLFFY
jgi:prostaglandin-H2 D-isomerase / glutathione transferase